MELHRFFFHFPTNIRRILWSCLLFFLVESSLCSSVDVNCSPRRYQTSEFRDDYCYIESLPTSNFSRLAYRFHANYTQNSKIEELELQHTQIRHMTRKMFTTFPRLKKLVYSYNQLHELRSDDFLNAMHLNLLDLDHNKLTVVRANVFSHMVTGIDVLYPLCKLQKLTINNNRIATIEHHAFDGLNDLMELELQFNRMRKLPRSTFVGLWSLMHLKLDHNRIESIEEGILDLPMLQTLSMDHNELKRLPNPVFSRLPSIQRIDMNFNHLRRIGRSFYETTNIEIISLERNKIRDIDLVAFAQMPNLKELKWAKSAFTFNTTAIEREQQWSSPLEELGIDGNNLSDASELRKLRIFPKLEVLDLSDNLFTTSDLGEGQTLKDVVPLLKRLSVFSENCDMWTPVFDKLKQQNVHIFSDCLQKK